MNFIKYFALIYTYIGRGLFYIFCAALIAGLAPQFFPAGFLFALIILGFGIVLLIFAIPFVHKQPRPILYSEDRGW